MTGPDRVIIFDTDGTLVDGRRAVIDAVAHALAITYEHFELPVPEPDHERIGLSIGLPSPAFFRTAFDQRSVPAELRDAFIGEFEVQSTRAEVAALRRGESRLYEGAERTLETLNERGFSLALYSNAAEPYFQTLVDVHRLDRWFSRTLSLEYAVRRRLARSKTGMVRYLARDFGDVIVVGDRVHDIDAGRAIGAVTVGCRFGFGDDRELKNANWQISRLDELCDLSYLQSSATFDEPDDTNEAQG